VLPKEKIPVPCDGSLLTLMFSQDTNRDFEWRDSLGAFETSCGCPPSHSLCHSPAQMMQPTQSTFIKFFYFLISSSLSGNRTPDLREELGHVLACNRGN
jgi:hypothetical protein